MKDWTKEFNAQPNNVRIIMSAIGMENQINGLKCERERLKARYVQSQKEITDHIKNIRNGLKEMEKKSNDSQYWFVEEFNEEIRKRNK